MNQSVWLDLSMWPESVLLYFLIPRIPVKSFLHTKNNRTNDTRTQAHKKNHKKSLWVSCFASIKWCVLFFLVFVPNLFFVVRAFLLSWKIYHFWWSLCLWSFSQRIIYKCVWCAFVNTKHCSFSALRFQPLLLNSLLMKCQ